MFVGIHNAWDTVTYLMMMRRAPEPDAAIGAGARAEPLAGGGADRRAGTEAAAVSAPHEPLGIQPEKVGSDKPAVLPQ